MSDRKYRQHGYQDRPEKTERPRGLDKPKPRDMTFGPRPVNMAPARSISRCGQCGVVLAAAVDVHSACTKCAFPLHSCKQCAYFDPACQFECRKPITERVARKDQANTCTFYTIAVRFERETSNNTPVAAPTAAAPTRAEDARRAFENLFKK